MRVFAALAVTSLVVAIVDYRQQLCCAPAPIRFFIAPEQRPDDLWFELASQTGSVSPRYFHRYQLRISNTGVVFTYSPGYGSGGPSWTTTYALSATTLDSLWADFRTHRFWELPPESAPNENEIQVGAGSTLLTVFARGQFVVLRADRRDSAADSVRAYLERLGGMVPDSLLWASKARQAALPRP